MDSGFSCFLHGFRHLNERKNNTTIEGLGSVFFGVEVLLGSRISSVEL
jgi:hypothetical protein